MRAGGDLETSNSLISGTRKSRRSHRKGNSVVESALMAPWLVLLFLGVLDFGFYTYAAISTQHAARVAVLYTASSTSNATDATGACRYALASLADLPNMAGVTTCVASAAAVSATQPVAVVATSVPSGADTSPAAQVSVTYQTVPVFPVPGLLGQMTITRTEQMRLP